jgi:hypothetical protein
MKFAVLVAILAEDLEEKAIDVAKKAGAGGVTLLQARGIGAKEKKTFLGLTFEGSQIVMVCVLERKLSLAVMKALKQQLDLTEKSHGVVFTLPLDHLAGIDMGQVESFEEHLAKEI